MNPFQALTADLTAEAKNLVTGLVASVGTAAVGTPAAQQAIGQVQAKLNQYRLLAYLGIGAAAFTFVFYVLPRSESPIPRIWRKRR